MQDKTKIYRTAWLKIRLQQCQLVKQGKAMFTWSQVAHDTIGEGYLFRTLPPGEVIKPETAATLVRQVGEQLEQLYRVELQKLLD